RQAVSRGRTVALRRGVSPKVPLNISNAFFIEVPTTTKAPRTNKPPFFRFSIATPPPKSTSTVSSNLIINNAETVVHNPRRQSRRRPASNRISENTIKDANNTFIEVANPKLGATPVLIGFRRIQIKPPQQPPAAVPRILAKPPTTTRRPSAAPDSLVNAFAFSRQSIPRRTTPKQNISNEFPEIEIVTPKAPGIPVNYYRVATPPRITSTVTREPLTVRNQRPAARQTTVTTTTTTTTIAPTVTTDDYYSDVEYEEPEARQPFIDNHRIAENVVNKTFETEFVTPKPASVTNYFRFSIATPPPTTTRKQFNAELFDVEYDTVEPSTRPPQVFRTSTRSQPVSRTNVRTIVEAPENSENNRRRRPPPPPIPEQPRTIRRPSRTQLEPEEEIPARKPVRIPIESIELPSTRRPPRTIIEDDDLPATRRPSRPVIDDLPATRRPVRPSFQFDEPRAARRPVRPIIETTSRQPEESIVRINDAEEDNYSLPNVRGVAGVDFPVYAKIPETNFVCRDMEFPGFYADMETGCQVYHSCHHRRGLVHSFMCPNGTIFSQEYLICDWWYNVKCGNSDQYYGINKEAFSSERNINPKSKTNSTLNAFNFQ
ncbi:hypothetical protein B4U80_03760, partial [Leptotrombidium deliense]